ncbi:HigA protein [Nitratiruptor sp. YY08-26]|uniref:hypothetical protein n=1 Tax=unclassified Nitratiruptor TaxID=2624044 RepID=UPI001914E9AA|nr:MULTISPECIES: hypothetical protein [unclassified Nitratiruptor]BCD62652.1 HigA protein [Nitratiruptor sp. YY08-13]BCD66588.1 HigA protein [Nitratiruptor sp. YY08-26]
MITANELKVKGIKAIESELQAKDEAVITFRGKPKYIVVDFERYEQMRAAELDAAYLQAQEEIRQGKAKIITTKEELEKHLKSL